MDGNAIYRAGDATITRVTELVLDRFDPAALYPEWDAAGLDREMLQLACGPDEEGVTLNVNVWILRRGGEILLIDTGVGNDKDRPFNPRFDRLRADFLDQLGAAGVRPEQVGHVLHTHLHVDHVGWNTRLAGGRWVPTFPRARHVMPQADLDYYDTPQAAARRMIYEDSVRPLVESGQVVAIGPQGGPYLDGIEFLPMPGHSPGHMAILVGSGSDGAIFAGDIAHNPVQVYRPDWNSMFCMDAVAARESRRRLFELAASTGALVLPAHFPESSVGRISRSGAGYLWEYV